MPKPVAPLPPIEPAPHSQEALLTDSSAPNVSCFKRFTTATIKNVKSAKNKLINLPTESIDPAKSFYYYWTFFVYIGFLYNSFMCVIFVFDDTQGDFFHVWLSLNLIFDFIFVLDILINAKLTMMEDGLTIRNWKRLAKKYFKSRNFAMDFLAVLPTDLILLVDHKYSIMRHTEYGILFHWNAALYFKISLIHGILSTSFTAWEFNYVKIADPLFATCDILLTDPDQSCGFNETALDVNDRDNYIPQMMEYWENQTEQGEDRIRVIEFSNFTKQYSLSIYWSSLTLTTSGQQPYPTEALHNFLEVFDSIVGVLVFAVIVGSVGNVVTTMNRGRAEIQQLMDGIKFYMNYRHVSTDIQRRVMDCVGYIQQHAMISDENLIMDSIPPRLQGELAVHLHMDNLRKVELLADCEASLLYELVLRLQMHMFAPNDFLCRSGDVAKEMFIVKSGTLESISSIGLLLETLKEGSYFGELSILKVMDQNRSNRRLHSLRSVGYSEVYVLKQEDVLEVLCDYPEARNKLILKAREILRERDKVNVESNALEQLGQQQIIGSQSLNETFDILGNTIKSLDQELDRLYDTFRTKSSTMKRRVTVLEKVYRENRTEIKNDYYKKSLRV
uniref:Cyclic nucleotide-binding domain-containing protein n=1 Tax=Ditylenchus dipsaci TaxID=166011 RepID=A0A915DYX4_9BILA